MTDAEILEIMLDRKKFSNVIASAKNGHSASFDVLHRATALFNQGAPCVDFRTGDLMVVDEEN
jgi:hypothetical protein